MVRLIRRFQQPLMIVLTVIIIIAFAWFYNTSSFERMGADHVGNAYGRTVSRAEYLRASRKFEICQMLGLNDLWSALGFTGNPRTRDDLESNFIWNSFVLRHEADALNIRPVEEEIVAAVQKMPAFQTSGVYDSSKHNAFVANALTPRGLNYEQFEEIVGDSIRLEKLKMLIGATNDPAPAEVRLLFERRNQKTEASIIRLKLEDFKNAVKVTDEELQARFAEKTATLQHAERRKVRFVAFTLEPTPTPLAGKERVAAMQKLADQAEELAVAMAAKDAKLDDVAATAGVKVQESPDFESSAAPAELGATPAAAEAAFKLTKEDPNSDVVSSENGYYVLQLADIVPVRPMTFEEAKGQLTEEMVSERANEAMALRATDLRNKITTATKAGKAFADAAKEAGAAPEPFPAFSQAEPKMDQPDAREIMPVAGELPEGEISEFIRTEAGGLLVHVDKRLPLDEATFEKEKLNLAQMIDRTKTEAAFQQWLTQRRDAAGIKG